MGREKITIESVSDFHGWLRGIGSKEGFIYRGQSNAKWQVASSAHRRLTNDHTGKTGHRLTGSALVGYLEDLIGKARMRGFFPPELDKECTDLELLAHLQHHGAATGLIDFTIQPLVALWFACKEFEGEYGAVYALPRFDTKEISSLEGEIKAFYKKGKGEEKLSLWQPFATGNRIVAQGSVFLFGVPIVESSSMEKLVIEAKNKPDIRRELETTYGISEESLFSDFSGYAVANAPHKDIDKKHAIDYWTEKIEGKEK